MYRAVGRVRRKLARSGHLDLSNLSQFRVEIEGELTPAAEFVRSIRETHRPELSEQQQPENTEAVAEPRKIPPSTFRPRGQTGLENFPAHHEDIELRGSVTDNSDTSSE